MGDGVWDLGRSAEHLLGVFVRSRRAGARRSGADGEAQLDQKPDVTGVGEALGKAADLGARGGVEAEQFTAAGAEVDFDFLEAGEVVLGGDEEGEVGGRRVQGWKR